MSRPTYVGNWLTRRVKLLEDEELLRASSGTRYRIMGVFHSYGLLTLTSRRLIWTPIVANMADPSSWAIIQSDMRTVSLIDQTKENTFSSRFLYAFAPWVLYVELNGEIREFGFGGWGASRQKRRAEEWLDAIRQWAN